ncbi:MAG: hypothetical protein WCD70_05520 [Alphaproteobacteria bacterium]
MTLSESFRTAWKNLDEAYAKRDSMPLLPLLPVLVASGKLPFFVVTEPVRMIKRALGYGPSNPPKP